VLAQVGAEQGLPGVKRAEIKSAAEQGPQAPARFPYLTLLRESLPELPELMGKKG
jgi:hypothetical protein